MTATVGSAVLMLAVIAFTPLGRWLERRRACARTRASRARCSGGGARPVCDPRRRPLGAGEPAAVIWLARRVDGSYGQTAPTVEEVVAAELRAGWPHAACRVSRRGNRGRGGRRGRRLVVDAGRPRPADSRWPARSRSLRRVLARFAEVQPLARPELRTQLADLARRVQVPVTSVDEWMVNKSARTSALVTGVGGAAPRPRLVELARDWSDDEIAVVVAHELAHHVYRDLWRTLALDAAVLARACFRPIWSFGGRRRRCACLARETSPRCRSSRSSPTAVWTMATPVRHAQSRRHERRADLFALAMTGRVEAFGAAIRRLGVRLLAEERPSALTRWLYHRHPTVAERLAMAEEYRRAYGSGLTVTA